MLIGATLIITGICLIRYSQDQQAQAKQEHIEQVRKQKAKKKKFYKTHFSKHVMINGINVGHKTVKQATNKINTTNRSSFYLQNNTFKRENNPQWVQKKQIQSFFKKQYTTYGSNKEYTYQTEDLSALHDRLAKMSNKRIQFQIGDTTYFVNDNIYNKIYNGPKQGTYRFVGDKKVKQFVNKLNKRHATLNKTYVAQVRTNGVKKIKLTNSTYGFKIDYNKFNKALQKSFVKAANKDNKTKTVMPIEQCLTGKGLLTTGTGFNKITKTGLPKNYIVVSHAKQTLWMIKNNKVIEKTPVVTGYGHQTPSGVFYVQFKQSPTVLKAVDGSYASPVTYWLSVAEGNLIGIHDASWRTYWGSDAWKTNGAYGNVTSGSSHGCINTPTGAMSKIYAKAQVGEPVIIL